MDTRLGAERLRPMNNEAPPSRVDRADRIVLRMRVLGVSQRQLADHLGISRTTVKKVVEGDEGVLERNLLKIENGLAALEEEMGIEPGEQQGSAGPITFQMIRPDGIEIILSGPVEDADEMRKQVTKMIEEFKPKNP